MKTPGSYSMIMLSLLIVILLVTFQSPFTVSATGGYWYDNLPPADDHSNPVDIEREPANGNTNAGINIGGDNTTMPQTANHYQDIVGAVDEVPSPNIRLNQLGFLPEAQKLAVIVDTDQTSFSIINESDQVVFSGELTSEQYWANAEENVKIADFSALTIPGTYRLRLPNEEVSFPFTINNDVFEALSRAAVKAFYFNRASTEILAAHAGEYARPTSFPDDQVQIHAIAASAERPAGTIISTPKGWFDAADYNKYINNSAISVFSLLSAYENYPDYFNNLSLDIPESSNNIPDILDETLWNIEWMFSMQDPDDGGVYFKTTNTGFGSVNSMPHVATAQNGTRYVTAKTTQSTLDFAAIMAMTARIYAPYLPSFAEQCLRKAELAWAWAQANPDVLATTERSNPTAQSGYPAISTGPYTDTNTPADEFFWAAAELFITTGNITYYNTLNFGLSFSRPSWRNVQTLGLLSLVTHKNVLNTSDAANVTNLLLGIANPLLSTRQNSPYRITFNSFGWGSNSYATNEGMILMQAFSQTGDERYFDAALSCLDYLLGRNATSYSFVSGYGSKPPVNLHHRISISDGITDPVPGLLAGGPNPYNVNDQGECGESAYPTLIPAKAYLDATCSYSTNEVAINWNAPLSYLAGAVHYVYNNGIVTHPPETYTLTVTNGTGDGDYEENDVVSIVADAAPNDYEFDRWTGDVANVASVTSANTTITMPGADVNIEATYRPVIVNTYTLTVASGTGSGDYAEGNVVNIVADAAPEDYEFDQWIGDVANVASVTSANTTITMPGADVNIEATYRPVIVNTYTLTVTSGSGSGDYAEGDVVNIVADASPEDYEFDRWIGDVANVASVTSANTTVTMPGADVNIEATYRFVGVLTYTLTVHAGGGDGDYMEGSEVTIMANEISAGFVFDHWEGDVFVIDDVNASSATFIMPNSNLEIIAVYRQQNDVVTIAFETPVISLVVREILQLIITTTPEDVQLPALQWESSSPSIVSVDGNGMITAMRPGMATITVSTPEGMMATITVEVSHETSAGRDIPLFFSPNNDAIGQYWIWRNIEQYEYCALVVFARNGHEVFSVRPYQNDWNGTYKSGALPSGDYYYILNCDDGRKLNGAVRIIR